MNNETRFSENTAFLSCKTVIRTMNFAASKEFYTQILNLSVVEEYNDNNGSRGLTLRLGEEGSNALIEISEIKEYHDYYRKPFGAAFNDDKSSIQIRTNNIFHWASILKESWEARGPILRPWGSQYLYLRDPDGLQIIMYQEKPI